MESGFLLVLAGLMGTSQIGRVIPLAGVSSSVGILRKWGCMVMVTLIVFCLHLNPSSAESSHKMATSYYDEGRCSKAACHRDALCFSTGKSYRCKCKEGFYGSGKICLDDNECDFENGGCAHHCANTAGNYTCSCLEGFRLDSDGHNCIDVDECFQTSGCHHICLNTIGGYECACRDGFSLAPDGKTCVTASSWCQEQYGCSHFCQSSAAGMMCACRRGFQLHPNGKNCTASCRRGNGGCHHKCRDTFEGPVCGCQEKYVLAKDRHTCLATCGANNGGCDRICNNTLFGPKCSCPPGYTLHSNGKTCIDVDECAAANGGCSYRCVNTEGSFDCLCPSGYKTDRHQRTCIDIDECSWNRTCDHHCRNENGGYRCYCRDGYDLYGQTHCADRDECSVNNGGCHHRCANTEGSFRCECDQGYRLHPNKRDCVVQTRSCEPLQLPPKTSMICSDVETSPSPLVATTSSMQRLQTVQSSQQQQQQQQQQQRLQAERVCRLMCKGNAEFVRTSSEFPENFTTNCGPSTEFQWSHELEDLSLPTCSDQVLAPGYQSRAKFTFMAENCKTKRKSVQEVEKQLGTILIDDSSSGSRCENGFCRVKVVNLKCDNRKRRLIRHLAPNQVLISAEFEMHVKPVYPKEACDVDCSREQSIRQLKKALKRLRTHINSNNKLLIRYEGKNYEVLKSSLKSFKPKNTCDIGQVLNDRKCVACSVSTFYSISSGLCESCPTGFYQDKEGQLTCLPCQASPEFRRGQAQQAYGCKDLCEPGNYSNDGLKPCQPCASGFYQPDYGRAMCISCGPGVMTSGVGSTGFHQCNVSESCRPGNFYDRTKKRCLPCPANTYQPEARKDYCISCPGQTQTDNEASTDLSQCKNRQCIGETSARLGFLQSPNWPGLYPADVECTWKISSEKGRRILVVIPEMHLASTSGQCEDSLVMRKAASPNSVLTFEICNSSRTPIAFTAKSRTLWIRFKADSTIHAKGFSIPYVTYSDDYQELIEDIVSDQKLYQHHQHQQVLQDRQLLSALLEVIEQPYNYFKYANVSHSMFPQSFIDLLRNKVIKFFGYNK